MNIIEQGRVFVESLRELASRSAWAWRRCPHCGQTNTYRNGSYVRRPWSLAGRQRVRVQRHYCCDCRRSYSEQVAWLVAGSWYARAVRRMAVDQWQHSGTSLRRGAEWLRSLIGHQERWELWQVGAAEEEERERCALGASTLQRWLDGAGRRAQQQVAGSLEGMACSGRMGTDGLWARLRGGSQRVVLMLRDSISGLLYPPVVVAEEESAASWGALFARAQAAGLELQWLRGLTSDGARGLLAYLGEVLRWVNQQRCVWHVWHNLGRALAHAAAQAATGLGQQVAPQVREQVRAELEALVHAVLDAPSDLHAEQALARLRLHPWGAALGKTLNGLLDRLFVYRLPEQAGLLRVTPEWVWRDFRLRLSHGRNHGSEQRLERAALLWSTYRNFTPAQARHEVKRRYPRAGKSPLELAGTPPGRLSYLDALGV